MKKINRALFVALCAATVAMGQGSLTPPGAPAPTMKTLEQIDAAIGTVSNNLSYVEHGITDLDSSVADTHTDVLEIKDDARTPLVSGSPGVSVDASGAIYISQSGSYYLTGNLTVSSGHGIRINASGVTLDLNGFTIRSTSATAASAAIYIYAKNVSVYNGHIESGVVYDSGATGDQYTGSGFQYGIYAYYTSFTGIRIRDITVSGVDYRGIYIASSYSAVESCVVDVAGSSGISAGSVTRCRATTCGGTAIYGEQVSDCRGESTGSTGIYATTVNNSYGSATSSSNGGADGIFASGNVANSYGYSAGDDGIEAITANNCLGRTISTSTSADGIYASRSVANSYGYSKGDDGIATMGTANNCYGYTSSTNTGAYGIVAYIANGCGAVGGKSITYKYNMP